LLRDEDTLFWIIFIKNTSTTDHKGGFKLVNIAHAMGQGGAAEGGAAGFASFIPLILMFVIFYFLLIRPQQKRNKDHRNMIANLKKGDRIITSGGLHGRVRVKLSRGNVATVVQSAPSAPAETKENKES
jgi:preprotein translocase subunit YajC